MDLQSARCEFHSYVATHPTSSKFKPSQTYYSIRLFCDCYQKKKPSYRSAGKHKAVTSRRNGELYAIKASVRRNRGNLVLARCLYTSLLFSSWSIYWTELPTLLTTGYIYAATLVTQNHNRESDHNQWDQFSYSYTLHVPPSLNLLSSSGHVRSTANTRPPRFHEDTLRAALLPKEFALSSYRTLPSHQRGRCTFWCSAIHFAILRCLWFLW